VSLAAVARQPTHRRFVVREPEDVGAARRAVAGLCTDPAVAARAGQATTELGTNLLRHAEPGGWILTRPVPPDGVEVLAVDRGPGILDVAGALSGVLPAVLSRGGGLGCGLAAVRRASSRFDLHSRPGRGTVVLAVLGPDWQAPLGDQPLPVLSPRYWAGVSTAVAEECGDAWAVLESPGALTAVVVDGLGHGVHASIAAEAAIRTLELDPADLTGFLARANQALRQTRGAGLAACLLREAPPELECLSVGNVSGRLVGSGDRHALVPYNGTLGLREEPPKVRLTTLPWPAGSALVLWSDGLDSRIDLAAEADLLRHDPAVAAAVLHREHAADRDDATVLVVRRPAAR
jgi:anti-sigma regulatory factor (Ser/Thr protein kinase)